MYIIIIIFIIRCSCFCCCCCCLNYSLPCRELLSLHALTAGLSAEASRPYILTKLTTWLYTELSKSYIKLRRKTKIVLQNRWRVGWVGGWGGGSQGSEHPQDLYYSSEHPARCFSFYSVPAIQRVTDGYTWTVMSSQTC